MYIKYNFSVVEHPSTTATHNIGSCYLKTPRLIPSIFISAKFLRVAKWSKVHLWRNFLTFTLKTHMRKAAI